MPSSTPAPPSPTAVERDLPPSLGALSGLEQAFVARLGVQSIETLRASLGDRPVILLAGDQLTGKSVTASRLATHLGGKPGSSGQVVRDIAAKRGISVEEVARILADEPAEDVQVDYRAARLIAEGAIAVFESRLAGHLGRWLRSLGRTHLYSVHLSCSPRERALRYVARAVSAEARARVEPRFDAPPGAPLADCLARLSALGDPALDGALAAMQKAAGRDEDDQRRLLALYGIDYTDLSVFDLRVDNSQLSIDRTVDAILDAMARSGFHARRPD